MLAEEFGGRFVTASAAHLSWQGEKLKIVLASAGHPGPVLVRPDGTAQQIPGGGVPLGIFPDPEPATLELELTDGDVLFFYTDGLADARSPQATYFEDGLADSWRRWLAATPRRSCRISAGRTGFQRGRPGG